MSDDEFKDELEEVEIKNAVEPQVFKYACDDEIDGIPYPLPASIFRMACIGKSGSGKSNLVQALTRFYTSVKDLPTIFDRLQNEEDMEGRTLIILDDLGSEIKSNGEDSIILKKLMNNGRHIGRPLLDELTGAQLESGAVSVMITAQKMTQLPRFIRSQLTHLAIFDCRNTKSEMLTLYDEFFACNKNIFNEILFRVFSKPYNFIFVDTKKSEIFNGFKSKFNIKNNNYL